MLWGSRTEQHVQGPEGDERTVADVDLLEAARHQKRHQRNAHAFREVTPRAKAGKYGAVLYVERFSTCGRRRRRSRSPGR